MDVATRRSPTARQRSLTKALVDLRHDAGLTQGQVAEQMGKAPVTVIRWERRLSRPTPSDVAYLCDIYDVHGRQRQELVQMAKEAMGRDWWYSHRDVLKHGFDVYMGLETEAVTIRAWEAQVVPGVLQTEGYARAVIRAVEMKEVPEVDEWVKVRQKRQAALGGKNAAQLVVVLSEAAIRTAIGGPTVMREQLNWLVNASGLPTVTLQILPLSVGAHAGLDGSFGILEFPPPDPAAVYLEQATSGLVIEDDADVRRYTMMHGSLTAKALNPSESRAFLAKVAREM